MKFLAALIAFVLTAVFVLLMSANIKTANQTEFEFYVGSVRGTYNTETGQTTISGVISGSTRDDIDNEIQRIERRIETAKQLAILFGALSGVSFVFGIGTFFVKKKTESVPASESEHQPQSDFALNDDYFSRGRKYKIWSIVNTCCLFPMVTPIIAIGESKKAQCAQDEAAHKKHIKRALILNLIPTGLILIGMVKAVIDILILEQ
jgi:hypothetical protein